MDPARQVFFRWSAVVLACLLAASCSGCGFKKKTVPAEAVSPTGPAPAPAAAEAAALQEELAAKDQAIADLEDKIALLEDKLTELEKNTRPAPGVTYKLAYSNPSEVYRKARNLLLEKKFTEAAQLFKAFSERHPGHSLADNALYWLGECHYSLGQYETAIQVFKHLVKTYPTAEKVPDALLKTGYAYISMDDINRADHFLKQVLKQYPFSPAAEKAQKKLAEYN